MSLATERGPSGKKAPLGLRILREFTDFPATTAIGLLWIVVYAAMALHQGTLQAGADWLRGGIQPTTAHLFGDLTSRELYEGQVWRTVTATFVHFSLIHLVLNLVGLYQLGRVVEDWHGSWRFVTLYTLIGGMGNVLAGLVRPWVPTATSAAWITPSGGGSTAIFGLVTLIGVGAWRSRTRFGDYAKGVALFLLVLNAALAVLMRRYIDNFGHAGGALVGALLGLAHPALSHEPEGRPARRAGWVGIGVLVACAAAQALADRWEVLARREAIHVVQREATVRNRLGHLELLLETTRERTRRGPAPRPVVIPRSQAARAGSRKVEEIPLSALRQVIRVALKSLDADPGDLDSGPTAGAFRQMHDLAEAAADRAPTPGGYHVFEQSWLAVHGRARAEADAALAAVQATEARAAKSRR